MEWRAEFYYNLRIDIIMVSMSLYSTYRSMQPDPAPKERGLFVCSWLFLKWRPSINSCPSQFCIMGARGRQRAILAYKISRFLFDFPVISLKNYAIRCKSGWGWRVGLISELDFKEICFEFSWFQLDFNWFLHKVYEISFIADPLNGWQFSVV